MDGRLIRVDERTARIESSFTLAERYDKKNADYQAVKEECDSRQVCSYIISLKFDSKGVLYALDNETQLWSIENLIKFPNEKISVKRLIKVSELNLPCRRTKLIKDFIVNENVIYFIDTSGKWTLGNYTYSLMEPEVNGRLLKYDLNSKDINIVLDSLWNPSSVELTKDKRSLLIAEASKQRILVYALNDEKRKYEYQVLTDKLPGVPEVIRRSDQRQKETYLILMNFCRTLNERSYYDYMTDFPKLRLFLVRLQYTAGQAFRLAGDLMKIKSITRNGDDLINGREFLFNYLYVNVSILIELNLNGEIIESFHSISGDYAYFNDVNEIIRNKQRMLFFASSNYQFIGKLAVQLQNDSSN